MSKLKALMSQKRVQQIAGSLILLAAFTLPFLTLADHSSKIYVDADASGSQTGSSSHPYKKIKDALRHADDGDEVIIREGKYTENIQIPEGVEVFGEDEDEVIITADSRDDSVVIMKDDSKINKVTIEKGNVGIKVERNAKASIIKCIIKDNDKSGIEVLSGKVDDKHKVSISSNLIENNGKKGIYSESRRIVIMDNKITGNESDGIDLAGGTSAWIEDNDVRDNDGSGMKLVLDGSTIGTNDNSFAHNDREGIEVNAFGGRGKIDIKNSRIHDNDRYGVARVKRGSFSSSVFSGLVIESNVGFWNDQIGTISPIIPIL